MGPSVKFVSPNKGFISKKKLGVNFPPSPSERRPLTQSHGVLLYIIIPTNFINFQSAY